MNGLTVFPAMVLAVALLFAACNSPTSDEPGGGGSTTAEQPVTKGNPTGTPGGGGTPSGVVTTTYTVSITVVDAGPGDSVTFSPKTGKAGTSITISYTVADTKDNNVLAFSGTAVAIADAVAVGSPESGTRTYTVNASDVVGGAITITAKFTHTDLALDPIEFTDTSSPITVVYGDSGNSYTNAIKPPPDYLGSGSITYTSSDMAVATVASGGVVTILKAGWTDITAVKVADAVYASSIVYYRL